MCDEYFTVGSGQVGRECGVSSTCPSQGWRRSNSFFRHSVRINRALRTVGTLLQLQLAITCHLAWSVVYVTEWLATSMSFNQASMVYMRLWTLLRWRPFTFLASDCFNYSLSKLFNLAVTCSSSLYTLFTICSRHYPLRTSYSPLCLLLTL